MNLTDSKISRKPRKYFSEELDVSSWSALEREFGKLESETIGSPEELLEYWYKVGEMMDMVQEEMARRYIEMTRFTDSKEAKERYESFMNEIVSKSRRNEFLLKRKFYDSPFRKDLDSHEYGNLNRLISNDIELFREENIPVSIEESKMAMGYNAVIGGITAEFMGEEKTFVQLASYMKNPDREVRENAWHIRMNKLLENREVLNDLFDRLKPLRIKMAKNAGFDNYRDYMHRLKGRFTYSPEDIFRFHSSVEKAVLPFLKELDEDRKKKLGVDSLRPWDTKVEVDGRELVPFKTIDDFIDKGIQTLDRVDHQFALNLNMMKNTELLDLENRKGKAPGGYNYPLYETGAPFIFMNAIGNSDNVRTLLHESGHAMHTFAAVGNPVFEYKHTSMEAAELASMSMEMLTMNYWDTYYEDPEDFKKAKYEELSKAVEVLPWCMTVDAFQQWIYTNSEHTPEERTEYFSSLMDRFNTGVDWSGLEAEKGNLWLQQLHIFRVPFYYIEYGIAQLGALALYRNYTRDPKRAVEDYKRFISLGYSKPLNELYEAAGIEFDFSEKYISELVEFVREELSSL